MWSLSIFVSVHQMHDSQHQDYFGSIWWHDGDLSGFFLSNGSNFARPHQRLVDGKRRPWAGGRQASLRRCRWFFLALVWSCIFKHILTYIIYMLNFYILIYIYYVYKSQKCPARGAAESVETLDKLRQTRDTLNDILTENDQLKIEVRWLVCLFQIEVLLFF